MLTFKQLGNYGRLGNQIFQYATLRSVGIKLNLPIKIPNGNYDLLNFDIYKDYLTKEDFGIVNNSYNEECFHFSDKIFNIKDNTDLSGYFQSAKYFDNIRHVLLKEIYCSYLDDLCNECICNIKSVHNCSITSVHVRRGDYVNYPRVHPVCGIKYYQDNLNKINDNIFIVFSDDINWCKNNLIFENKVILYQNNGDLYDFVLMSKCDNNIISNSSYSWWAAYLNQNKNKIIKYPKVWFGIDGPKDTYDLIPQDWSSDEK